MSRCKAEDDVHYNPFRALKFTADGQQTISLVTSGTAAPNLEYSVDNGKTWVTWDYSAVSFGGGRDFYLRGNNPKGFSTSDANYSQFTFGDSGVTVECRGNIMHLLSYESDLLSLPCDHCFRFLFKDCTALTVAPELPATKLRYKGYNSMFRGCTSLLFGPSIIPAANVPNTCCYYMFYGCTNLKKCPELPATSLGYAAYNNMFNGCSSITEAPDLPTTTFDQGGQYTGMFANCTSLTMAPELLAEKIPSYGYREMFSKCSSLNYIKCLATDMSAGQALYWWVDNVSPTGTFVKKAGVEWPTGVSGIPTGWTVEEV